MDAETLDKQFQKMEGDTQVQAAANSTQQQKPKQKRVTTAQLQKELNDIKTDLDEGALSWLGELDSRLNHLEAKMNDVPNTFAADIAARIKAIENATGALADAMRQISEGAALWGVRMEECEDMIAGMSKDRPITQEPTTKSEIEFASPPQTPVPIRAWIGDIEAVARVCLNMNDILMVCRALKAAGAMSDDNKIEILRVACRRAGEVMTPGLQIRAGIKYMVA